MSSTREYDEDDTSFFRDRRAPQPFTEAEIQRSQSLLAAILGPMCEFCGTDIGLRMKHDGGGFITPAYTCEACFTGQDDGPCFDDLPAA